MFEIPEDPQVLFDTVAKHLLKQNEKSKIGGDTCLYRGPRGLKCAAGCLIPDDEYSITMENKTWDKLAFFKIVPTTNESLIGKLQQIHDYFDPESWLNELYELAAELNLNTCVLLEFQLNPENNTR